MNRLLHPIDFSLAWDRIRSQAASNSTACTRSTARTPPHPQTIYHHSCDVEQLQQSDRAGNSRARNRLPMQQSQQLDKPHKTKTTNTQRVLRTVGPCLGLLLHRLIENKLVLSLSDPQASHKQSCLICDESRDLSMQEALPLCQEAAQGRHVHFSGCFSTCDLRDSGDCSAISTGLCLVQSLHIVVILLLIARRAYMTPSHLSRAPR